MEAPKLLEEVPEPTVGHKLNGTVKIYTSFCRLIWFNFKSISHLWKCRNPFSYVIAVLSLGICRSMMALGLVNPSIKGHCKVNQYGYTQNCIYGVTNNRHTVKMSYMFRKGSKTLKGKWRKINIWQCWYGLKDIVFPGVFLT